MKIYPLGQFILAKAEEAELTRRDIVPQLGYANLNKAYKRFDEVLRGSVHNRELIGKIAGVLKLDPEVFRPAVEATERELEEERRREWEKREARERAAFVPHLWVVPERSCPSPIFVVAFMGENCFRRVELPDGVTALPRFRQLEIIGEAAQTHYREKEGSAGPFGKIIGYLYRVTYDEGLRLDVEGNVVGTENKAPATVGASIRIGHKTIEGGGEGVFAKLGFK